MKKYLVGFVVGVILTVGSTALADQVSKIGKKITDEYTVKLDGKELPVKAVAIDGTSYAPLRAVGETLGLEVGFENREVLLSTKGDEEGNGGDVVGTTYKGLGAVEKNGEIYFSLMDYSEKFTPYSWRLDREKNTVYLAEHRSKDSSDVVRIFVEVDLNTDGNHVIDSGMTYVNSKYYKEPSELK